MAERMLITKLVRTEQTRADLYAKGHQWPDLKLFDLSDLVDVEIDPSNLQIGLEVPCKFWAIYELSAKLNKAGNPYKDVISLEPLAGPATTTSTDTSALLAELRAIRGLLERIAQAQGIYVSTAAATPQTGEKHGDSAGTQEEELPLYGDGNPVTDNPYEREAYEDYLQAENTPPESVSALRQWVRVTQSGKG